ncbi:MAG: 30S ribosome-binding factor RbfA [Burkholderiales bacterium]|jgi:ribosome-binding factor A|nr:30S ribosome-binding factor RbfA [Burkholderiales bacterium]
MANAQRRNRVADQIQRELSDIIRLELRDPRVHLVTITGVNVTPDLMHAKVFVTTLGAESERDETLTGLRRAAGYMRSLLGKRLHTHSTPELHFEYDPSIERGVRLTHLIDEAVATAKPDEK